jgi:ketosteroid isomerase-like protein
MQDLDDVIAQNTEALTAMRQGDPVPSISLWSDADDVTLFGAWGPIEQGAANVFETFRWVADRFGPEGSSPQDIAAVHQSGDLAVTVGFERGTAQVDGGSPRDMVIRVTHVYRREHGEWRIVHRHADFPPEDQRLRSVGGSRSEGSA